MRRTGGFLLLIYGLAHAAAGVRLVAPTTAWIDTVLWRLAIMAFLAAGAGLLGFQWLDQRWRAFANVGAVASLLSIMMSWHPVLMIGAAIDGGILLDAMPFVHQSVAGVFRAPERQTRRLELDDTEIGKSEREPVRLTG